MSVSMTPKGRLSLPAPQSLVTDYCQCLQPHRDSQLSSPETTSSDSMSAEALSEAVAEVNLEHTCDHVKAVFPRCPNILLDLWASSRCRSLCLSSDLKD